MIKAYFHGFHAGSFCLPEYKRDLLLYDRVHFLLPYDDVADVGLLIDYLQHIRGRRLIIY